MTADAQIDIQDPVETPTEPPKADVPSDPPKADVPPDDPAPSDPPKEPTKTWREAMAGDDEKFLNKLKRYGSEADFGKSYREMEQKLSTVPKALPENPTEEDLKAYRASNGIPETPDKYEIKLSDGLVIGDEDKPIVDEYLKYAHGKNATPADVNSTLDWYYKTQDQQQALMIEREKQAAQEAVEVQREKWGPEYSANKGMISAWVERQGEAGQILANARDESGIPIMSNVAFIDFLNNHIRQTDPSATVVHDVEMSGRTIEDEIKSIQDVIRNDPQKYSKDKKMQERMAQLSAAKQRNS